MREAWLYCGTGIVFCITGLWQFFRNIYEEDKTITGAILVIAGGLILVGIGTAKYFGLIS